MVVIQPFLMPNVWCSTFASGARQLVVHDAFEMIWCFAGSYLSSLTPSTTVMSGPFAGAVMTTFFAPAATCLAAASRFVNRPVDSNTTSTPRSFHGSCAGSFTDRTLNDSLSTVMVSSFAATAAWRLPRTESYLKRCASVCALVRSLTATKSIFESPSAARMMLRPIRPNPLIPTRTGISASRTNVSFYNTCAVYSIYSALSLALFVVVSPYFLYQAIRYKKYIGSLRQRLGFLPITFNIDGEESIWIHAVSVGEALTARALAADLRARYPRLRLFVSTTTIAGQQVARRSLSHADAIFYFPFDWTFIVKRTLSLVKPRLFIMMETEIWPNLLRVCRRRGVKTIVINGRISSRSYPRYRLARPFFRRVLADVDRFCMQSEESARRLVDLGADPARVTVTGSLKFDSLELPQPASHGKPRERVLRFFRLSPNRTVVIAGSTMRGEEPALLRAFARIKTMMPGALLIVAPRAPERFGEVENLAREAGFSVKRRSELPIDSEPRADVVVLDSIGELAQLYQVATAVFVGGSLADHGGHNILEPAIFGKPIVFGPYMQNFKEIADAFLQNGAAIQVHAERELDAVLLTLASDPVRRAGLGAAARALVEANRGAKTKTLDVIANLLPAREGRGAVVRPFRPVR